LGKEYAAIVDSGILVQIDDPFLPDIFFEPGLDDAQKRRRAQIYVEATNTALRGIPADRVRFHTCYGINEGPRIYEAALSDIIAYVLKINAGSFSFEAANPRHEHEYHLSVNCHLPALKGIKYAGFAGRTYVVRRPLSADTSTDTNVVALRSVAAKPKALNEATIAVLPAAHKGKL
jgi:5-methyltetrahydropteroyltriglutamate--homocysteine methyltransferase